MSRFIPSIAELINDSIIPMAPLKMLFAALVTVESIPLNAAVKVVEPSPLKYQTRPFHSSIAPSLRAVHLVIKVFLIESQSPER